METAGEGSAGQAPGSVSRAMPLSPFISDLEIFHAAPVPLGDPWLVGTGQKRHVPAAPSKIYWDVQISRPSALFKELPAQQSPHGGLVRGIAGNWT